MKNENETKPGEVQRVLNLIIKALEPLNDEERDRVLKAVAAWTGGGSWTRTATSCSGSSGRNDE